MIESLFAFTQLVTVLPWASLSDRWGRKPVMLQGLCGVFLSQIMFGFATSIPQLIFARCLAGALNGNVAILKSVVGEITDDSNRAKAFQFLPVLWAVGCSLGSLIGGMSLRTFICYADFTDPRLTALFEFQAIWRIPKSSFHSFLERMPHSPLTDYG